MVSEFSEADLRSIFCSVAGPGLSICTCGGTWTCKPQGTQPHSSCWYTDLHTCTSQVAGPSSSWPWAASLPWINFIDPLVSSCLTHRDTHANLPLWYPVHIMALLVANHRSHGLSHCSGPPAPSSIQPTDLLPSSVFAPDWWLLQ